MICRKASILCHFCKSRVCRKNPQKLTQFSPGSHPRHLVGKRTAEKDTIRDIISGSQVNSNFSYKWSTASLTFNIYLYLFPYLYSRKNNKQQHTTSKTTNESKQKSHLKPASIIITGEGVQLVCSRSTFAFFSALVPKTLSCSVCEEES